MTCLLSWSVVLLNWTKECRAMAPCMPCKECESWGTRELIGYSVISAEDDAVLVESQA